MTREAAFVGVDVGTESVRAGVFTQDGEMRGLASRPIQVFRPAEDFVEQSSDEIWRMTCAAVKDAVRQSGLRKAIRGIGFDATCSLVALDREGRALSVSPSGRRDANVIVWMDHRARDDAAEITRGKHKVLRYVGGVMSPEMQLPKIRWIKRHLSQRYRQAGKFLDLSDFLVYRATGVDTRSVCTVTCKWTYLAHERRWDRKFFERIGLADLLGGERLGERVADVGTSAGTLTRSAASDLQLDRDTVIAVALIDAHSGGVGMLGRAREDTLGIIGGTSSCHMAISLEPTFVPGVWGPYYRAMLPGYWLNEGGQSATGALIDHVIQSAACYPKLLDEARAKGQTVYQLLNAEVLRLERDDPWFNRDFHLLGDFHGNRSPRADPDLRGMISGLSLNRTKTETARAYLAAIESIALGTRHIIEAMNKAGHRISKIRMCGGATKNPVWLREHADATGCPVLVPRTTEAMLLGGAMNAAAASGTFKNLSEAMARMSGDGDVTRPRARTQRYHDAKYAVFHRMHDDQISYQRMMRNV
ncbi:MAG TPA: FGGY-family carbohydrate kinase [Nevskiaceae bacterium]|nr:FGGY-family carbohydrate kinase [Nevskiaceae bacterium]